MTVLIASRCTACGACIATCPQAALAPAPLRPVVLDSRCTDCLACLEVCPVDSIIPLTPLPPAGYGARGEAPHPIEPHPIEAASYRILSERVDLSAWAGEARAVVARMVHATADESFAASARVGETAIEAATAALRASAVVVCDGRMVQAGMPSVRNTTCLLDEVPADRATGRDTRSAAAIRLAATRHPTGALWVIGNAPTALLALLELHGAGRVHPAAVVGLPVGYVAAAEAKAALWESQLRSLSITNTGERGGSSAAAAAVNALARLVALPSQIVLPISAATP